MSKPAVSSKLTALIAEARSLALESATASLDMRIDMFQSWAANRRKLQVETSERIWARDGDNMDETAA
jgi:hypothetical protein